MKYIFLLLLSFSASADLLIWELPTERENGEPLYPGDITQVILHRNGQEFVRIDGEPTEHEIPSSCSGAIWTAFVVAGETSVESNPVIQAIQIVGCKPMPITTLHIIVT